MDIFFFPGGTGIFKEANAKIYVAKIVKKKTSIRIYFTHKILVCLFCGNDLA